MTRLVTQQFTVPSFPEKPTNQQPSAPLTIVFDPVFVTQVIVMIYAIHLSFICANTHHVICTLTNKPTNNPLPHSQLSSTPSIIATHVIVTKDRHLYRTPFFTPSYSHTIYISVSTTLCLYYSLTVCYSVRFLPT